MEENNVKNKGVHSDAEVPKEVKLIVDEGTFKKIVMMAETYGVGSLEFNVDTAAMGLNFRVKDTVDALRTEENQKEKPADDKQKNESAKIEEVATSMEMIVDVGEEPYANLLRMAEKYKDINVYTKINTENKELHIVIKANENSLINKEAEQKVAPKPIDSKQKLYTY